MSAAADNPLAAADPRRSAWVSANAGAGKTHALATRVARLLLEGARPERILCLTYTKSAAAEMQARLFAQLGDWSMFDDDMLSAAIATIGGNPPDASGLKYARRLFALALETPGGLKIQTIHSFCERLLGRFPVEAGIPPAFQVLDEQTARDLVAEARAQVLERAGAGDSLLAAAIGHIVTLTSEHRLQQILGAALGNDRRKLERIFSVLPEGEDGLRRLAQRSHGVADGETVQSVAQAFCAEAKTEAEKLKSVVSWLSGGSKTEQKLARELAAFTEREFSTEAFHLLRSAFCTDQGSPRVNLITKGSAAAQRTLADYVVTLAERYVRAEERCRAVRTALLAHASLTLADAVRAVYNREKRARGALDYNDLITETLSLLNRSEAASWVLYKLDGGLDHVLIDEAQDTSPEQWQIVQKLTEEFFAGAGTHDLFSKSRTVFAVGDQKQSIFSFQGADPGEFDINRRHFAEHAGEDFVNVPLQTSRRSAPEILTFVDAVFADPEARSGLVTGDDLVKHHAFRADAKGRVELWPAVKPAKTDDPDCWRRPVDAEPESSAIVQVSSRIAATIRDWLDSKITLQGHEQPIRAGDIMILMPRREPFATEIIRKLTQHKIPVAGADRIRLKNEIAVMDLIALGRFALLREDDLNLAALLRSPLAGLSEEELFALANPRKGGLWRELAERKDECHAFAVAHEFLATMLSAADFSPPYEFFAHALFARNMRARMLARLGPEAADALDEFLALALEYEKLATPSLEGFLHWVERGDAEVKRDMERGRDQVRVMTVHGAKGLEADIVFLPDTTTVPEAPGRRGELLYADDAVIFPIRNKDACPPVLTAKDAAKEEAMQEYRRLLYVALTRAKDRLYICGAETQRGIPKGSWYTLLACAMDRIEHRKVGSDIGEICVVGEDVANAAGTTAAALPPIEIPEWAKRAPLPETERPRLIRPSDESASGDYITISPTGSARANAFRRGLLIHTLLARLPEIAPGDRARVAQSFLRAQGETEEDAAALMVSVLEVLDHPDFAHAFAPGSRAETAIVANLPEFGEGARVSGRIDRLAVTDDEVLIIDYKTNRPPPQKVEDVAPLYVRQMALYRLALSKLYPQKRIACALVWTEGPALMPLPDAVLDRQIEALTVPS